MYRVGKLLFDPSYVGRRSMPFRYIKHFLTGVHNFKEPCYESIVFQHTLSYRSTKAFKLNSLDLRRVNSTKDMSSSSVNEEFRHLDYNQFVESKNTPNNIIIDVREKSELEQTGVIPGAHHIPLGDIETAFKTSEDEFKKKYNFDKPSTEHSVVFSCRSGKRSLVALEKALANGFKNQGCVNKGVFLYQSFSFFDLFAFAKHYKGGWLDWETHLSEAKN